MTAIVARAGRRVFYGTRRTWRRFVAQPEPERNLRQMVRRVLFAGTQRRCPVCESSVRLFREGWRGRVEATCPVCGAHEWGRYGWWVATHRQGLLEPPAKRMLHVAPEGPAMANLRRAEHVTYVTFDLMRSDVDVRGDLLRLPFPDDAFDVVYCSHVLEHVPDDLVAMAEIRRVLSPSGWASIQVPITAGETWGDPSVTDPDERERLFGQDDHVRVFGPDVVDRLTSVGLQVERRSVSELPPADVARFGFPHHGQAGTATADLFLCRKGN